ncbi:MAG: nucleotidyltransferase family protein [Ahrensia sp.]|nr:nucleotidyltransferase family protein [Ahrensia sp.]
MSEVAGIILAAGQSRRMGKDNKLTTIWQGAPLVRHVAEAALASRLQKVVVVTGHEREFVEAALPDGCLLTHNGDYEQGMAGSIRNGQYRLQGYGPIMILLGDMPLITAEHIDMLIAAYETSGRDDAIVVATSGCDWGNPVLFGKAHFAALKSLDGDVGARSVVNANADCVITVDIGDAARRDFDTPDAFARHG